MRPYGSIPLAPWMGQNNVLPTPLASGFGASESDPRRRIAKSVRPTWVGAAIVFAVQIALYTIVGLSFALSTVHDSGADDACAAHATGAPETVGVRLAAGFDGTTAPPSAGVLHNSRTS